MKRICALSLALALLLCAGCGTTAQHTNVSTASASAETSQIPSDSSTEAASAPAAGFTIEDVVRENTVSNLISAYGSVQMLRYENDTLYSETYYFLHDGKPVWTRRSVDPEIGEDFYCFIDETGYSKEDDHLQFTVFVDEEDDSGEDYSIDFDICEQMMDGEVGRIEIADADTWQFEIVNDEPSSDIVCRCTVTRQTLTLKTIEWIYGYNDSTSRIELRHGSDVKAQDFGMLQAFDKPTRTVRCICELHDENGKPITSERTVETAYNAEPLFASSNVLNLYLDKNYTKEYVYPGDGIDYTVYATDAMG